MRCFCLSLNICVLVYCAVFLASCYNIVLFCTSLTLLRCDALCEIYTDYDDDDDYYYYYYYYSTRLHTLTETYDGAVKQLSPTGQRRRQHLAIWRRTTVRTALKGTNRRWILRRLSVRRKTVPTRRSQSLPFHAMNDRNSYVSSYVFEVMSSHSFSHDETEEW